MIFFVLPDDNRPIGGIKQAYRNVQILSEHGLPAFALHKSEGFTCDWFEHSAPTAFLGQSKVSYVIDKTYSLVRNRKRVRFDLAADAGREVKLQSSTGKIKKHVLNSDDLIVLPEFHGYALNDVVNDIPVAVFNQNPHGTFRSYPITPGEYPTIYRSKNLAGVVVVSEHSRNYLEFAFPDLMIHRVINGVDKRYFHSNSDRKNKSIAFMPRKLPRHVEQVINLLRYRGALDGWLLVPINGLNEQEVAKRLRESTIFISTCTQEGFGLPPLEAAMSGCYVVGYTGQAAEEYMDAKYCEPVPQDDVLGLAIAVERALKYYETRPQELKSRAVEFSSLLAERYSLENEKKSVIRAWSDVLENSSKI